MRRSIANSLLLLAILPSIGADSVGPPAADTSKMTVKPFTPRVRQDNGVTLPYQLLIPKDYAPGKSFPLIVWLHGAGEKGNDNIKQARHIAHTVLADPKIPAFVLIPQCPADSAWHGIGINQAPDVPPTSKLLITVIGEVQKEFKLDPHRIYIGGFSMGAIGAWEMLMRYPDVFAAAFPIAGGYGDRPALAPLVKHTPIWAFHGDNDKFFGVTMARENIQAVKSAGGNIKYTEYPGGTHECTKALAEPELLKWLLAQKRAKPADYAQAKVPEAATMITRAMEHGTKGTWKGPLSKTLHNVPRITIDKNRYRLQPAANADPSVAATLAKIAKGELKSEAEVTGTVVIDKQAAIAVEKITALP